MTYPAARELLSRNEQDEMGNRSLYAVFSYGDIKTIEYPIEQNLILKSNGIARQITSGT